METLTPELDASGARLDFRMTQNDPINFQFIVQNGAAWAGAYTMSILLDDDTIQEVDFAATVSNVTDALFAIISSAIPEILPTSSGYRYTIKAVGGPTRFDGLLRVEAAV